MTSLCSQVSIAARRNTCDPRWPQRQGTRRSLVRSIEFRWNRLRLFCFAHDHRFAGPVIHQAALIVGATAESRRHRCRRRSVPMGKSPAWGLPVSFSETATASGSSRRAASAADHLGRRSGQLQVTVRGEPLIRDEVFADRRLVGDLVDRRPFVDLIKHPDEDACGFPGNGRWRIAASRTRPSAGGSWSSPAVPGGGCPRRIPGTPLACNRSPAAFSSARSPSHTVLADAVHRRVVAIPAGVPGADGVERCGRPSPMPAPCATRR